MKRIFTDKSDLKLIQLVHDNPLLYDYTHEKYMDYNAREVLWQKIGDELKKCAVDCKVRWINIRDVHRRILRQELQDPGKRLHQYKYSKELAFMRPFYRDITTTSNENEENEEEQEEQEKHEIEIEYFDVNNDCESDNDSDVPIKKIKVKRGKNKKKTKRRDVLETEDAITESTSSEIDITNPVDTFLLSIGTTLKKLTPYRLNLAKTQIFSIVQEHEYQQIIQNDNNIEKDKNNDNLTPRAVKRDESF